MKKSVMVGMSGGVDSSVTAALLKDAGYDVIGITLKLWGGHEDEITSDKSCCSLESVNDARRVADKLNIPFYVLNFTDVFEKTVVDYFTTEYLHGRTPNPCIMCNRAVKFGELLNKADSMGIDYIATGHYATIEQSQESGRFLLKKSQAVRKDQTYVLYNMTQRELSRTLMPLGAYDKEYTRELAKKLGLLVADKPDSQDICFIPDGDYVSFLKKWTNYQDKKGYFKDEQGNILGEHNGIIHFTVGQRKGLGVTFGKPMFVTRVDSNDNSVILGEKGSEFSHELIAEDLNFIPFDRLNAPIQATCKVRYSAKESPCTIIPEGADSVKVTFSEHVRAVTPGQSAVFYDGDVVIGGGVIK